MCFQVPVQLPLISALSKIRISVPSDLRPLEARQSILLAVQELESRFPQGLPKLNPVKVPILQIRYYEFIRILVHLWFYFFRMGLHGKTCNDVGFC